MNDPLPILASATLMLATGIWLMLPRGWPMSRPLGAIFVAASLGLYLSQVPPVGDLLRNSAFLILAAITVLSAAATVTFRNPVYCAIWFGLSLLGTAGLFLYQGAQFLGVATVVVYAGAILVTFLFVLMLAQPKGEATYDRLGWQPSLSALTGALIVGVLTLTLIGVFQNPTGENLPEARFNAGALDGQILAGEHMAHLGAQLFSNYLVAVEVAGTLLLVALVGTVVIVGQIRRPAQGGHGHG